VPTGPSSVNVKMPVGTAIIVPITSGVPVKERVGDSVKEGDGVDNVGEGVNCVPVLEGEGDPVTVPVVEPVTVGEIVPVGVVVVVPVGVPVGVLAAVPVVVPVVVPVGVEVLVGVSVEAC